VPSWPLCTHCWPAAQTKGIAWLHRANWFVPSHEAAQEMPTYWSCCCGGWPMMVTWAQHTWPGQSSGPPQLISAKVLPH
jgi:hypothetical protein